MVKPISLRIQNVDRKRAALLVEQRRLRNMLDVWTERLAEERSLLEIYRDIHSDAAAYERHEILRRIKQCEANVRSYTTLLESNANDVRRFTKHRRALGLVRWHL
jgi:hypothetical protein